MDIFLHRQRFQREKRKLFYVVVIGVAALMLFPAVQSLSIQPHSSPMVYRYGNEVVEFNGQNTYVGFGNSLYPVSWSIFRLNAHPGGYNPDLSLGSLLSTENFTHHMGRRILNASQNSAVMEKWNHNVRIAEIFSFLPDGIDASIAIENTGNSSGTFIGQFGMHTLYHANAQIGGFSSTTVNTRWSPVTTIVPIHSDQWSLSEGHVSVNWAVESSIFHAGVLAVNTSGDSIELPFGPVSIAVNDTYSIDPIIRPDMPIGGGGGGSYQPFEYLSGLSVVNATSGNPYNAIFGGDTLLKFSVHYDGSRWPSSPVVKFDGISQGGSLYPISPGFSGGGSGTITWTWAAQPGYYQGFAASATYATPVKYFRSAMVYTNFPYYEQGKPVVFPDAVGSGDYYNSNGNFIAQTSQSAVQYDLLTGQPLNYQFNAGLWNKSRTLGVWSVDMGFEWKGNNWGQNPSNAPDYVYNKLQSYSSQGNSYLGSNSTISEQTIWNAIALGLGVASVVAVPPYDLVLAGTGALMTFVGPFLFSTNNVNENPQTDQIWKNFTGTEQCVPNAARNYTSWCYFYLLTGSGGGLSYLFRFMDQPSYSPVGSDTLNYFTYIEDMTVMQLDRANQTVLTEFEHVGSTTYPTEYSTSISMPVCLLQS